MSVSVIPMLWVQGAGSIKYRSKERIFLTPPPTHTYTHMLRDKGRVYRVSVFYLGQVQIYLSHSLSQAVYHTERKEAGNDALLIHIIMLLYFDLFLSRYEFISFRPAAKCMGMYTRVHRVLKTRIKQSLLRKFFFVLCV